MKINGLVGQTDLLHRSDRHLVLAEQRGHRREHAGPVQHVERQVIGRLHVVDRAQTRSRQHTHARVHAAAQVVGRIDHVAEHGTGAGCSPGTTAVEHEISGRHLLRRTPR
jgi:hypothetical protein